MPEYVYAVHLFEPENEDELGLRVGECIEVIEKDDEFGDGWWQVRFCTDSNCIRLDNIN